MHNLMQDWPLRVNSIIDHAAQNHPERRIITRALDGGVEHTNWRAVHTRAKQFSQALCRLGVQPGDVVGCMAWNTARHMEAWYGVPGAGAVLHTLNPRLFEDQLVYVITHAEDSVLLVDPDLLPIIEGVWDRLSGIRHIIVLSDRKHMPQSTLPDILCSEELLAAEDGAFSWVEGGERDACGICYTSGTTGNPKGVVYTHRSNVLHALSSQSPDMLGLSASDVIMPVVPLFHANGWSIGYTAPLAGASLVMPGRDLTPAALYELLEQGVTITAAVPTIWLLLLQYLEAEGKTLSSLKRVVIGGSSCPRAVIETFQNKYGVQVLHAWGMTEMSPLGTVCSFKPEVLALPAEQRTDIQETVGHAPYTVELRITDDDGIPLPHDGEAQGKLWARGPAVVGEYLKQGQSATDADGWFDTGDVATIDPNGYVRITDRSKDVIKSGGEWISSIDLENSAVGHPDVLEAAAIGIPHPKWDERPILVVVPAPGRTPDKTSILQHVAVRFAKWQVPDDVVVMDEIPHTATGKISKLTLRQMLKDQGYKLPG